MSILDRFNSVLDRDWPGLLAAFLAGLAVYNTVLNNAYAYGSTLHDSGIFGTVIWRSGWLLTEAPTVGGNSYFNVHMSPIQYIPDAFSYLFPGERMDYYGLVYGCVHAALIFVIYLLCKPLIPGRHSNWLAALLALSALLSEDVFQGAWEPHVEQCSPVLALFAFRAWQLRRYKTSLLWFCLSASVREDMGGLYAMPLVLLAGVQYWALRLRDPAQAKEKLRWGSLIVVLSLGWMVAAIAIQKHYFTDFDLFHVQYFTEGDPLGGLTPELLQERAETIINDRAGIWLPCAALLAAAVMYRDAELLVGALAFVPYVLFFFLSKDSMAATISSYKPFPFVLCMLWPALMAIGKPGVLKSEYLVLQVVALACGLIYFPNDLKEADRRWLLKPVAAHHRQQYEDFYESYDSLPKKEPVRISQGVLALFPYKFPIWGSIDIRDLPDEDVAKVNTFIWFQGDRDQEKTDKILSEGKFIISNVPGTKIRIARRKL